MNVRRGIGPGGFVLLVLTLVAGAEPVSPPVLPAVRPLQYGPPGIGPVPYGSPGFSSLQYNPYAGGPYGPGGGQPTGWMDRLAGHLWADAEFLLWWVHGSPVKPVVTVNPVETPPDRVGVLGDPTTQVLYANRRANSDVRPGIRLRAGGWLDDRHECGIEVGVFMLDTETDSFSAKSAGDLYLSRPFINTNGDFAGFPISQPGTLAGRIDISTRSTLWGAEINRLCELCRESFGNGGPGGGNYVINGLIGYRYLHYSDRIDIRQLSTSLVAAPADGTVFAVRDVLRGRTDFNGVQVGLSGRVQQGSVTFLGRLSCAVGCSSTDIRLDGDSVVQRNGVPTYQRGGFLAAQSSLGTFGAEHIAILPELSLGMGWQVTSNVRLSVGYNLLYLSEASHAGDGMDLMVNTSQLTSGTLVGTSRPRGVEKLTDVWAQGLTFGIELNF